MALNASLSGRIRNTSLPKSHALLPLFEAVVNSIQSIDERVANDSQFTIDEGNIDITIKRDVLQDMFDEKPEITGFSIKDNGAGFNESNFQSFQTLDSGYKVAIGGKGIGRILYLKVFNHVKVKSSYGSVDGHKAIEFDFNSTHDIHNTTISTQLDDRIETVVELTGILNSYSTHIPKKAHSIANQLFEHCIWYFIRKGGAPNITIYDSGERIKLNALYDSVAFSNLTSASVMVKSERFDLTHVKVSSQYCNSHSLYYCANNRIVKSESLKNRITGLFGPIEEEDSKKFYNCYVESEFFNETVNQERTAFMIEETSQNTFFEDEVYFSDIRSAIIQDSEKYLGDLLENNKRLGFEKTIAYIDNQAPKYRYLLNSVDQNDLIMAPDSSDKERDLKLHSLMFTEEKKLLSEGHDLLNNSWKDDPEYQKRLEEYAKKATDLKQSELASYVMHRRSLIDLVKKAIECDDHGKYPKESVIHNLLMPMGKESSQLFAEQSNLWMIDERLAFHSYMASDKSIRALPITGATDRDEPDIVGLNIFDNPLLVNEGNNVPLASITVVELKRPMRNDGQSEDKNPIDQALDYLDKIRKGEVKTPSGRLIPNSDSIPGFCYIIADLTPSMVKFCQLRDLIKTQDQLGYFGYHKLYKAYIEVLSYSRLVNGAIQRNRAFFDKLSLPCT